MSFLKTIAVSSVMAVVALSSTAASAHKLGSGMGNPSAGKLASMKMASMSKMSKLGKLSQLSHRLHHLYVPAFIVGSSSYDCSYYLNRFRFTGSAFDLDRYEACRD